jgi:ketosteroid isomerase-like protein
MSRENVELVIRGYRAFIAGDLITVADTLDPEIEWRGVDPESPPTGREDVLRILADRYADGYRVELERCIGKGDQVLVSFRAAGTEKDPLDDRPLQTRRYFTIGRYWAIVTVRGGRVVGVQDYPNLDAALEALGLDDADV